MAAHASSAAGAEPAEGRPASAPSGRLLLRMPRTLHAELAQTAQREGTSLNQFITSTLASAIGWRGDGVEPAPPKLVPPAPAARPSRMVAAALVANVVVVGITGIAAIAVLLVAWLG